jgi:hypothetical protein
LRALQVLHYQDCRRTVWNAIIAIMFRAIGLLILLVGVSKLFSGAFTAIDQTAVEILHTVSVAAETSRAQLTDL